MRMYKRVLSVLHHHHRENDKNYYRRYYKTKFTEYVKLKLQFQLSSVNLYRLTIYRSNIDSVYRICTYNVNFSLFSHNL